MLAGSFRKQRAKTFKVGLSQVAGEKPIS